MHFLKTSKFETYFGKYYCKKCGKSITETLYFIGNDDSYCDKCFLKVLRKIKLEKIERLK